MTKKFTEEQFKQLVKIQEKYFPISMIDQGVGGESPYDAIIETDIKLSDFIWDETLGNEAVAIMNLRTREFAYEQYVEKEKKYVWTSKKPYYEDFYKRLYMASNGLSKGVNGIGIAAYEKLNVSEDEYLTETEVRNNGYNPEWFDKEEV